MEEGESHGRAEVCHRCLEPVSAQAVSCPNCGVRLHKSAHLRKFLAMFALLVFVVVAVVAFRMLQANSAPEDPGPAADETHRPGQPDTPPPPQPGPALGQ